MRGVTIAGFVGLAAVAVGLHVAGRARRAGLAPLGELVDALRASTIGRVTLIACWLWLGWHFLAR